MARLEARGLESYRACAARCGVLTGESSLGLVAVFLKRLVSFTCESLARTSLRARTFAKTPHEQTNKRRKAPLNP